MSKMTKRSALTPVGNREFYWDDASQDYYTKPAHGHPPESVSRALRKAALEKGVGSLISFTAIGDRVCIRSLLSDNHVRAAVTWQETMGKKVLFGGPAEEPMKPKTSPVHVYGIPFDSNTHFNRIHEGSEWQKKTGKKLLFGKPVEEPLKTEPSIHTYGVPFGSNTHFNRVYDEAHPAPPTPPAPLSPSSEDMLELGLEGLKDFVIMEIFDGLQAAEQQRQAAEQQRQAKGGKTGGRVHGLVRSSSPCRRGTIIPGGELAWNR